MKKKKKKTISEVGRERWLLRTASIFGKRKKTEQERCDIGKVLDTQVCFE